MYSTTLLNKIDLARKTGQAVPTSLSFSNFSDLCAARAHSSEHFLTYIDDKGEKKSFTYQEFITVANSTSSYLLDQGLKKGDRIATIAHNHWQTIIHYFAAWQIGLTVVPVNLSEDDDRIVYILKNGSIKLAFLLDSYKERIQSIISKDTELSSIQLEIYNAESIWTGTSDIKTSTPNSNDDALIVFTSGTTGNPKAVLLSQQNLLEDAHAITNWHQITSDSKMMCVLPIHHVNGTVVTHVSPFYVGASVVLNQKFSVKTFFKTIDEEKIHIVSVVPTLLQYLNHEYADKPFSKPETLRHIICGAGPLTVEVAKNFETTFSTKVLHGYGLSETTCYSCFLPVDLSQKEHSHWMRDHGYPSIGVPIPCNDMDIHDQQGQPLNPSEKGEIVIRGYNVMKEYFGNEDANDKAFTFNWFRSGDEGFYLEDDLKRRFFFITGRIKELIIRGGVNLAPLEIDEVINRAPGVKTGISVGFPNDWYGEEVGAYVQLKEGSKTSEEEIINFCKLHLPYSKCPKVVLFGNEIPVTSTGKYQRMKVVHLFSEWKTIQFKK